MVTVHPRNLDARIILLTQKLRSTAKILLREYFRKYGIPFTVHVHADAKKGFYTCQINIVLEGLCENIS